MHQPETFFFTMFTLLIILFSVCKALDCTNPPKIIQVSNSGKAKFKTIQSAIDTVPSDNSQWIHIQISPGVYRENVTITAYQSCIFLEGAGMNSTTIEWDGHASLYSPTFTTEADNTVVKGITFMNTYNDPVMMKIGNQIMPAEAARIQGNQSAFLDCAFLGVQDTLLDHSGRHYFYNCFIQGAVDFICGNGQSIYEKCTMNFSWGRYGPQDHGGTIAAQKRDSPDDTSGFVFKNCEITGKGRTMLGRGWRRYSRVIIANSVLGDVVDPLGWAAWHGLGHEEDLTFVEEGCSGPGADKSKRVPWMKHLSGADLDQFLNMSFIDEQGWIAKLPTRIL